MIGVVIIIIRSESKHRHAYFRRAVRQSSQCLLQGTVVGVIIVFVLVLFRFYFFFVLVSFYFSLFFVFVVVFVDENHTAGSQYRLIGQAGRLAGIAYRQPPAL